MIHLNRQPRFGCLPLATLLLTIGLSGLLGKTSAQTATFEQPPIDYLNAEVNDRVAKLAKQIHEGSVQLKFDTDHGYLESVLQALDIPISSQTLVFSKTSLQLQRISPRRPRAVYFNDDVYVGWCQNGDVLEFAATDPAQGAIFYTLEQNSTESPQFVRDRGSCLTCHASSRTQNVPGYLVRSVFPDGSGYPILGSGTYLTDHTSPMHERWGGWYVTGTHGTMNHMGNVLYNKDDVNANRTLTNDGANCLSLDQFVSTKPYLSPHSDLVALMVLEHQTQMHNAITAANFETRQALHQSFQMNELLGRGEGHISESASRRIDTVAENVVRHLLLCDELQLTDAVRGTSAFAAEFVLAGRRDSQQRSLRDLDLSRRLFCYPCSYLIDSAAFDALPGEVRNRIYDRLVAILRGEDQGEDFNHLSSEDRVAIREILADLKPEFAARL